MEGQGQGSPSPSAASSTRQQQQAIADLMAQSSLHLGKYKQIRDDYNGLLFKRSGAVSSSKLANQASIDLLNPSLMPKLYLVIVEETLPSCLTSDLPLGSSQAAKDLVEDMQSRLTKEIEEREAEAALYSCEQCLNFTSTRHLTMTLSSPFDDQPACTRASGRWRISLWRERGCRIKWSSSTLTFRSVTGSMQRSRLASARCSNGRGCSRRRMRPLNQGLGKDHMESSIALAHKHPLFLLHIRRPWLKRRRASHGLQ